MIEQNRIKRSKTNKTKANDKLKTIPELSEIIAKLKKEGKTVGMITGCFDIIHIGHIELLQFAKQNVDIVIVGLDSDETLTYLKGKTRPIFSIEKRIEVMSELQLVDCVFQINSKQPLSHQNIENTHKNLTKKLLPTHIITHPLADKYWKNKSDRCSKLGITFLQDRRKRSGSSTEIVNTMMEEL